MRKVTTIVVSLLVATAVALVYVATAAAHNGSASISCTEVTFSYNSFAEASTPNVVSERIRVDGATVYDDDFAFGGSGGSHVVAISVPQDGADHLVEARASWDTNGHEGRFSDEATVNCGQQTPPEEPPVLPVPPVEPTPPGRPVCPDGGPNAEGLVVYLQGKPPAETMLKIKQEDYIALHRIVTGLNERVIWERLGDGETVDEICAGLPEEFQEWVTDVYVGLQFRADSIYYDVRDAYDAIMYVLGDTSRLPWTRKDFALRALKHPDLARFLFLMHDGRDVRPAIWRTLKPSGKAPREWEAAA